MPKKGNAKLLFTQLIEQGCGASSPDRNKKGEIFMLNAVIFNLFGLFLQSHCIKLTEDLSGRASFH